MRMLYCRIAAKTAKKFTRKTSSLIRNEGEREIKSPVFEIRTPYFPQTVPKTAKKQNFSQLTFILMIYTS